MKRKFLCILCGVLLLGITGCGKQEVAQITKVDATKEELTYSELFKINKENEISFEENYIGAEITVNGEIAKIIKEERVTLNYAYDSNKNIYETQDDTWNIPVIVLKDGWRIYIFDELEHKQLNQNSNLSNLKVGDKIKVKTHIIGVDKSITKSINLGTLQVSKNEGKQGYDFVEESTIITKTK